LPALLAAQGENALAVVADAGVARGSAGYVGVSDGWQDFHHHRAMTWQYAAAGPGNVALMGELAATRGTLALAFADTPEGARTLGEAALASGWSLARERFIHGWRQWARGLEIASSSPALAAEAYRSAMVLKVHDDRTYPGAMVASMSTPWGASRDDPGGYHLVSSRRGGGGICISGLRAEAGGTRHAGVPDRRTTVRRALGAEQFLRRPAILDRYSAR
jgi:glucoamylase